MDKDATSHVAFDEFGETGPCRVQRLVHPFHFIGADNAKRHQLRFGAPARIKFHRERDELE